MGCVRGSAVSLSALLCTRTRQSELALYVDTCVQQVHGTCCAESGAVSLLKGRGLNDLALAQEKAEGEASLHPRRGSRGGPSS
eukprot:6147008-Pyramimonas_sp.AAC.1